MSDRVDESMSIISAALGRVSRPYVAFSGGKDSLVVAHLVSRIDDSIPMVYCDDELLYPEHVRYMLDMKALYGARLRVVEGGSVHGGWFVPWRMLPRWRQPDSALGMEYLDWMHQERARGRWKLGPGQLAGRLGYDSVCLGLRRGESLRRADILEAATGIDMLNGVTYINPIIDWTTDDVWEYIHEIELPYCGVYDVMDRIGVGRHKARVGPLPLSEGQHLWRGWPWLYIALVQRYGRRWTIPRRRPHDMDMLTWLELREVLDAI